MADVDEEAVEDWLRGANHILGWSNKFNNRVVKFCPSPAITWLIPFLVPIKHLRNLI